jgi:HSP20 family protein
MSENTMAIQTTSTPTSIKVVEPKSLFERINKMHEKIERRAYEIFRGNGGSFKHDIDDWFKAEAELLHPVHVNVTEADGALTAKAEVPGFEAKDLNIGLEPHRLTISGKRESHKEEKQKGNAVYAERCSNEILRLVDLPVEIDPAKTTATLKNGIIELTMPKVAEARKAAIKTA